LSPIRHDYKPTAVEKVERQRVLPWFAAGLGLPLIALALYLSLGKSPATEAAVPPPAKAPAGVGQIVAASAAELPPSVTAAPVTLPGSTARPAADVTLYAGLHPPLALPPRFEKLTVRVNRGDTLDRLFRKNSLNLSDLAMMLRLPDAAPYLKKLLPGDELTIEHDADRVVSLYRELDVTSALKIHRDDGSFVTEMIDRPLEIRRKAAHGRIETSLFESAAQAGIADKTVMNLAGIFAWDVDFVLDIRTGDDYYVLYEQLYQDGQYLGDGEIIAAEFDNNGRTIQAIRFIKKDGRSDYYTPDGHSIRKAFVRAPVDFTRISSNFNPRRKHPILNTIRAHRGVDYAAPRGTPVKAAGDGKVIFRGNKHGYGRTMILQHGGNITSLYAHLNAFDRKALLGRRVVQGQTIAYVGMSGLATAPHLHYEYRVNGVHRNPRTVRLPRADPISDEYRDEFLATVAPILDELLQYKRTRVAALADE